MRPSWRRSAGDRDEVDSGIDSIIEGVFFTGLP